MEHDHQKTPTQNTTITLTSNVDTSRPFRSVKEAVAVFGERLLVGDVYSSPKPSPTPSVAMQEISAWKSNEEGRGDEVLHTLKKLEAELEETKQQLRLLKEREEDTEVALASLNAELHKNMSKLAEAEAAKAASGAFREEREEDQTQRSEWIRMRESATLAEILSIGERRGYFGGKKTKKKPIIPLVGDLFSRKKASLSVLPSVAVCDP